MDEFNCLKDTEPLQGDSLLFTFTSPGKPTTHFLNPLVLSPGPFDCEYSALTTRSLLELWMQRF